MSAVAARLLAVPLGLLAVLLRRAADDTLKPLTEGSNPGLGLLAWISAVAVSVAVPLLLHRAATYRVPECPSTFRLDERHRRFVAPRSPRNAARWVILVMWVVSGRGLVDDGLMSFVAWIAFTAVIGLVVAVVDRPWIALDADGVTVQLLVRRRHLPWTAIDPAGPQVGRWGHLHRLALLPLPDERGHKGQPLRLPVDSVQVDDGFLAAVIRRYLAEPARREEIGTAAELDRLRADLTPISAEPHPA
jgi:hypothetical protein